MMEVDHQVNLLERTLDNIDVIETKDADASPHPERLLLDKGYDGGPLRRLFDDRGIEMIRPHRKNRVKTRTQDGRKLWR